MEVKKSINAPGSSWNSSSLKEKEGDEGQGYQQPIGHNGGSTSYTAPQSSISERYQDQGHQTGEQNKKWSELSRPDLTVACDLIIRISIRVHNKF